MTRKLFENVSENMDKSENRTIHPAYYNAQAVPHPSQDYSQWMGNIAGNVAAINANVMQCGGMMQNYVATVERRLDEATRKKRRAVTRRDIVIDAQGNICIGEYYDDGSDGTFSKLMLDVRGEWNVYRLKFEKTEVAGEWFGISFPKTGHLVVGKCENITKGVLYRYFVQANVLFNAKIKETHIENALFTKFAPLINDCRNVWTLPELAGWNGGKFLYSSKVSFATRRDFPRLPIAEKNFRQIEAPEKKCHAYFQVAKNICRWQDRIFVLTAPVAGIMSSVLAEEGMKNKNFLNFVLLDTTQKEGLVNMLQIFNREISSVIAADANDKIIKSELEKSNDELVIVDAVVRAHDKQYVKQKKRENAVRIYRQISERIDTSFGIRRAINAMPVFLNSDRILDRNAKNIYIDRGFWGKQNSISGTPGEGFEAFLTLFVDFAERYQKNIRGIIRRFKLSDYYKRGNMWEVLWEIYMTFWQTYNVDIRTLLNVPKDINWAKLLNQGENSDELKEVFVQGLRQHIGNFTMAFKRRGQLFEYEGCVYDNEYIWIPVPVMNKILHMCGLGSYKYDILCELRKSGGLVTDTEGFTCRLQIGGKRTEMYRFRRELFNVLGEPDIIDLGRRCGK